MLLNQLHTDSDVDWRLIHNTTFLHHPRKGAPHVQVFRLPMQTPSYEGFCLANDGSGGIASNFCCKHKASFQLKQEQVCSQTAQAHKLLQAQTASFGLCSCAMED